MRQVQKNLDQEGIGFSRNAASSLKDIVTAFASQNIDYLAPLDEEVTKDVSVVVEAHITTHSSCWTCSNSLNVTDESGLASSLRTLRSSIYRQTSFSHEIDEAIWDIHVKEVQEMGSVTDSSSSSSGYSSS